MSASLLQQARMLRFDVIKVASKTADTRKLAYVKPAV